MAPLERMDHSLTSSRVSSTCGPVIATAAQRSLVISVLRTDFRFFLCNTMEKGVWIVAPWC